ADTNPNSIATADFDGDGKFDLAVTNSTNGALASTDTVSILPGNGDGTFRAAQNYAAGSLPGSVATDDFNGDRKPAAAVGCSSRRALLSLPNNGDGTFPAPRTFATQQRPMALAVEDLNGDHKPDVVATNHDHNTVSVLLGQGDGTFQAQQTFPTGIDP